MRAHTAATLLTLTGLVWPAPCRAQTSASADTATRQRAAAAYDRGVTAYDAHDYAAAARAFLDADALVPNDDALTNAVAAAREARERALLQAAGSRAAQREHAPALIELGRAALAEAEALPSATDAAPAAASAPTPQTLPQTPPATASVVAQPAPTNADRRPDDRTWSPAVFYAGAGATLVLTGLTVWSGIDALNAKAERAGRSEHDNEAVMARAHRTDALLAATLVTAGASAYIGLRLVGWHARTELKATLLPRTAAVTLRGVF